VLYKFRRRDKLANFAGVFYAFVSKIQYLGSDPRADWLMPRLPLAGEQQRESGTLFYFRAVMII